MKRKKNKLRELEELERRYSEKGIELSIFKKFSNPHPVEFCKIYKEIQPEPYDLRDVGIAQLTANKYKNIRFEEWDMSRDDEPPFSRKAYMLVSEITGIERTDDRFLKELDRRVEDIIKAENEYSQKVKKRVKKSEEYIEIFVS